ncbi:MAG: SMP-30/gluconolactonase/LRE family protein, partial [Puniceicoccales bacterium]
MKRLTCFAAIGGEISEGPLWWGDSLWWIDVPKGQLHRCPQAGARWVTWDLGMPVGCVAPIAHSSNQVVAALQHGFYQITLGNDGTIKELTQINDPEVHLPDNRFNDGKCDPQGRFWAGTMSM